MYMQLILNSHYGQMAKSSEAILMLLEITQEAL